EVFLQHRSDEILQRAGVGAGGRNKVSTGLLRRLASQRESAVERLALAVPPLRAGRGRVLAAVDDMVAEALGETQIPNPRNVMKRYPHELSGGMRQRVMIAQALACN